MPQSNLDNAFKAFKSSPTAENAWKLQQEMVAYEFLAKTTEVKPLAEKQKKQAEKLKTKRGGKWDALLKEILELFAVFKWDVVAWKSNEYVEAWKVTDAHHNQAVLYLTTNGFSMGGKKPNEVLTGSFEGYEEQDRFDDFLVSNGIEIDE